MFYKQALIYTKNMITYYNSGQNKMRGWKDAQWSLLLTDEPSEVQFLACA